MPRHPLYLIDCSLHLRPARLSSLAQAWRGAYWHRRNENEQNPKDRPGPGATRSSVKRFGACGTSTSRLRTAEGGGNCGAKAFASRVLSST